MIYAAHEKPQKPLSMSPPPNDGTPLGPLSDADLVREFARELARRRAAEGGKLDLDSIESFATDVQRDMGGETLVAVIEALYVRNRHGPTCTTRLRALCGPATAPPQLLLAV